MTNETILDDYEILRKKAKAFKDLSKLVHITYKKGFWKRGYILEISSDFFILAERLEGDIPIFYQEITEIQAYKKETEV